MKDESKSDCPAALLSREQAQCQNKSGRRAFLVSLQPLAPWQRRLRGEGYYHRLQGQQRALKLVSVIIFARPKTGLRA